MLTKAAAGTSQLVSGKESPFGDKRKRDRDTSDEKSGTSGSFGTANRAPVLDSTQHTSTSNVSSEPPTHRKRRVSADGDGVNIPIANPIVKCITKPGKRTKKPQLKYDPDVPMTKEEAAIWRREQRRKRNRDSAAASRQRQRDRIAELEEEVEQWKVRYDHVLHHVRELEHMVGVRPPSAPTLTARDIFNHRAHPSLRAIPRYPPRPPHEVMMRGTASPTPCHPSTAVTVVSPHGSMYPPMTMPHGKPPDMYHGMRYISPYHPPPPPPPPPPRYYDDSTSCSDEPEDHIVEYSDSRKRQESEHTSKISSRPAASRIN